MDTDRTKLRSMLSFIPTLSTTIFRRALLKVSNWMLWALSVLLLLINLAQSKLHSIQEDPHRTGCKSTTEIPERTWGHSVTIKSFKANSRWNRLWVSSSGSLLHTTLLNYTKEIVQAETSNVRSSKMMVLFQVSVDRVSQQWAQTTQFNLAISLNNSQCLQHLKITKYSTQVLMWPTRTHSSNSKRNRRQIEWDISHRA
jgi:hypothetical protein